MNSGLKDFISIIKNMKYDTDLNVIRDFLYSVCDDIDCPYSLYTFYTIYCFSFFNNSSTTKIMLRDAQKDFMNSLSSFPKLRELNSFKNLCVNDKISYNLFIDCCLDYLDVLMLESQMIIDDFVIQKGDY